MTYKSRTLKQCYEWVNGNSIHNFIDNECCPDFSCCVIPSNYKNDHQSRLNFYHKFRRVRRIEILKKYEIRNKTPTQ
jgi:hypothetical protein